MYIFLVFPSIAISVFVLMIYRRKALKRMFVLSLLCFQTACSTISSTSIKHASAPSDEDASESRLYQLYIDSDGNLLDPGNREKVKSANEQGYIDEIMKNFYKKKAERPETKLTIFVHGGLNSFENATERVTRFKDEMLGDGKYPLFISWDSGFPGNYRDHLLYIRRGLHPQFIGPISSPLVLLEDATRSVVHIPESVGNVLFGQRTLARPYETKEEKAACKSFRASIEAKEFNIHFRDGPDEGQHTWSENWSMANPVKLFTAPLIDGFGKGTYGSMLRRTDLVLRKSQDFDGIQQELKNGKLEYVPSEGTAVAKFLTQWQKEKKSKNRDNSVIIIGHSMGTIIANNIIAKYPEIEFESIVYMGAATRMKDIEYVVAPYLVRNQKSKFYNLSLHPYRDINESDLYDFIPRGSLLIWIDQTLADINSFQDRSAGFWFNMIRSANQVFSDVEVRKRVYLTRFSINDGSPQTHGSFGRYHFWKEDFWTNVNYQRSDDSTKRTTGTCSETNDFNNSTG